MAFNHRIMLSADTRYCTTGLALNHCIMLSADTRYCTTGLALNHRIMLSADTRYCTTGLALNHRIMLSADTRYCTTGLAFNHRIMLSADTRYCTTGLAFNHRIMLSADTRYCTTGLALNHCIMLSADTRYCTTGLALNHCIMLSADTRYCTTGLALNHRIMLSADTRYCTTGLALNHRIMLSADTRYCTTGLAFNHRIMLSADTRYCTTGLALNHRIMLSADTRYCTTGLAFNHRIMLSADTRYCTTGLALNHRIMLSADTRASTLSSAVTSLSSTGMSFSRMDEKERLQALEEEQARLQALKDQRLKEIAVSILPSASPSTQSMGSVNHNTNQAMELFNTPSTNSMPNLSSDLFDLQPAFIPAVQSTPSISTAASAWGGAAVQAESSINVDFDAVFGGGARGIANNGVQPAADGFDALGDLLKPTVSNHNQAPPMALHHPHPGHPHPGHPHPGYHPGGKLLANDLDSSLANLVGNLQFGGAPAKNLSLCAPVFRPDMQWSQSGEKRLTGGHNWQSKTMTSTTAWNPAPMAPAPMPVQHLAPAPMPFPMTTPQVPMYGMVPQMGQMGGVQVMAPQPMMYNQPVLRPTNPFSPMPGAQMQFM
uniref:Uncharacterized LOC115190220 n=1 Tax=Salmo trutta TaxID=8032 RepID=A0A674EVQ0_SALTR